MKSNIKNINFTISILLMFKRDTMKKKRKSSKAKKKKP